MAEKEGGTQSCFSFSSLSFSGLTLSEHRLKVGCLQLPLCILLSSSFPPADSARPSVPAADTSTLPSAASASRFLRALLSNFLPFFLCCFLLFFSFFAAFFFSFLSLLLPSFLASFATSSPSFFLYYLLPFEN